MNPALRLTEALSPQERYDRELSKLLAEVGRLEEQSVRRLLALLTEARRRIIGAISEVPDDAFMASWLTRLQAEVERNMADYVTQYERYFTEQAQTFFDLGIQSLDRPLTAAGAGRLIVQLPTLDPAFLDILQGVRASLVTGVSNLAIDRITTTLQLGVLSGESPFQLQRAIGDILRTQPDAAGRFGSVALRSEAILRTELNRTFSMATTARQAQFQTRVAQVFPELQPRKQWVTAGDDRVRPSHRRMHGVSVPMDDAFTFHGADGRTYQIAGPYDPTLPAAEVVHCRCRVVADVDSLTALLEDAA